MSFRHRFMAMSMLTLAGLLLSSGVVLGQGCVAVHPMSCASSDQVDASGFLHKGEWEFTNSYEHFKSFRHFRGSTEEANRVQDGTQVENRIHSMDLGAAYGLSDRMRLSVNIPLIHYDRSSLYEHYGNSLTANPTQARFHTGSRGIGDMRISADYWIFNPAKAMNGNISVGLGIKTNTGNADVQDQFHKLTADGRDSVITKKVDQSIQLGDSGWGLNLEIQGFQRLFDKASLYFNGFYLINPKNTNAATSYSVADQYAARMGINYAAMPEAGLAVSLGGRLEGVPSNDLIGKSEGFRRPGYIISVEPGLSYSRESVSFTLDVPYALYRNRTQSFSDKQKTQATGVFTNGDAAFADYLINFNVSYQLGKKRTQMEAGH